MPASSAETVGGHVLAIDVGTSVTRVSAVSPAGRVLASAGCQSSADVTAREATLDAESLWRDVSALIAEVVRETGAPRALGVSALLGTVVTDDDLTPVAPALLWQDRRAESEAAELAERLCERAATIAGRAVVPELAAPCLVWLARHLPGAWTRARWVLSLKDFLVARLTGHVSTDSTSASYTLLFDVARREWSAELVEAAQVPPERLPPVLAADTAAGGVSPQAAAATGLPEQLPVAVGGPDGSVGALGSGLARPGMTVAVAGTTDVLLHTLGQPRRDPHRRSVLNAFLLPGLWTIGGPTGMTGGAITWLCRLLGYPTVEDAYRTLGESLDRLPPGAGGVTFRTTLTGERFPSWSPGAAGAIEGLRPHHAAEHLLRAAEEGAAFVVRRGLDVLEELGIEIGEIRLSGGSSRRKEMVQLRANIWGRPVAVVRVEEATTMGAAILGSVCGGVHRDVAAAVDAMVVVEAAVAPEPEAMRIYDDLYDRSRAASVTALARTEPA